MPSGHIEDSEMNESIIVQHVTLAKSTSSRVPCEWKHKSVQASLIIILPAAKSNKFG